MKTILIQKNTITRLFLGLAMIVGMVAATSVTANAQYGNRRPANWDGYPNWGGSYQLRQTALNAGFNEGSKEGAEDRARGRRSAYSSFSSYQRATKDYNSRLGNRSLYQRYFRRAFESGYDTQNNTGNWNSNNPNWNNNNPNWNDNRGNRRRGRGRNWDQYGTFGGSYQLRQTALNAGYNEGHEQGREDRDRTRPGNFRTYEEYREATKDYSSRLGDRELYRRYFREGYENGYYDGYDGY
jgi:hypothetical protein